MNIEEAIGEFKRYMNSDCYLDAPSNEACELAIRGLRRVEQNLISKMIAEKEQERYEELFKLMEENPALPVVPIIRGGICRNWWSDYLGNWSDIYIDEYAVCEDTKEVIFRSDDDASGGLARYLSAEEWDKLPDRESERREIYEALPWVEAIIVYIESAD